MSKLDFHRIEYKKYNTCTIVVTGASLKLENCKVLQKDDSNHGYQKAVLKLSSEKVIKMKKIEEVVNKHLEKKGLSRIKLVYGNIVYPKIKIDSPKILTL